MISCFITTLYGFNPYVYSFFRLFRSLFFISFAQIRILVVPDLLIVTLLCGTGHHNMWCIYQLKLLPDIVFIPLSEARHTTAENPA